MDAHSYNLFSEAMSIEFLNRSDKVEKFSICPVYLLHLFSGALFESYNHLLNLRTITS